MAVSPTCDPRRSRRWELLALAILLGSTWRVDLAYAQHPLEPPDTSSPRETLVTFLTATDQMLMLIRDEGAGKRTDEGLRQLTQLDSRSQRTLDLSEIAPEARIKIGPDVQVYLYEVLSRIELPPMDQVPGPEEIDANPDLNQWTLPHTEIAIRRVAEGPRRGEFLFDPETVARAQEFFERTQGLPYRRQPPIEDFGSFLEVYGGWNVPMAWVDALPSSLRSVAWNLAWWKWIVLVLAALANLALVVWVHRLTRRKGQPRSTWGYLFRLALPLTVFVLALWFVPFVSDEINLTGAIANALRLSSTAVAYLSLAWAIWLFAVAIGESVATASRIRAESLDASLIRLTSQVIGLAAAIVLIFRGASEIGLPLVGLVASISIGGLAIALAAQDTLKSLLGSLTILIDQPYRVGERIVAGGHDGVVERIGLRSTRIRQLDGNVTSIPNERMAAMNIENIGRRGTIRRKAQLRVAIGTPRDKVEQAVQIVREILADHEGMPADNPPRVYFDELNPDSLSIRFFYWYGPPDYWAFSEFSERVNLEIIRRFAEAGIALAPPTSAMHLADESGQPLGLRSPSEAPPPET
ncbi:MAG: mechanosensitive ion channel [Myxococcales bacterium]|nr:mechanosensitive ion channel [Myxococcales bacterium]